MCIGAYDVLELAGGATTNAGNAGGRGGRQLARMFTHTSWTFLVGFFPRLDPQARREAAEKGVGRDCEDIRSFDFPRFVAARRRDYRIGRHPHCMLLHALTAANGT